ncbi:serine/threonine-protein kinase C-like isoform X2 [Falco naumanni]|uniref:serine/threonine-protein kinase C-like isoform X2 n=1 Tax=Falco naumanni TaxID=148594 RepID=UPI001ADE0EB3|nr:serine/threonine-protein kinase C-like isoform X2 [Falco naumanni]XP_040447236.1 serine/threonine-protein kinase C-like isoform X2 [Falco naumanni]
MCNSLAEPPKGYTIPNSWPVADLEPESHPTVPSKPGEDHHGKIYQFYEPNSDDVTERPTELYNPPSPPTVSSPRDPGKLYTIAAVAAVVSLQVAVALGYVVVWWRRKKKAPGAGASADQLEKGSCPSRPDSWTQQEPLPSGRAENQASPRPPCRPSPSPASVQQSRQSSAVQPMTDEHHPLRLPTPFLAPRQQRREPRTLQHPTKTQRPRRPPSPHPAALERRRQSSSLEPQDQPQSPSHPPSRLPSTLQQHD